MSQTFAPTGGPEMQGIMPCSKIYTELSPSLSLSKNWPSIPGRIALEPSQMDNEALESDDLSRGGEQDEVRLELERSANLNPALGPRERKAGCKNFFWKTFTSC
uniref:Somatostatin/Cortistatin C-terminal domain-containing protein n=1 Tax=Podarcis muralis TaxID=64176 RepID=A0A670KG74_PODMU